MAAEANAGIDPRLTLDYSSFEKLLAAAWVLQCLQDQLHGPAIDRDESIAEPIKPREDMVPVNSGFQVALNPVLQFLPSLTEADNGHKSVNASFVDNSNSAEPVKICAPVENRTLNFDVPVKIEVKPEELKKSLPPDPLPSPPALKPLPVLATPSNNYNTDWAKRRAALHLRTAFSRTQEAFNHLLSFRVKFTLRAIRALAIATPVWLLSLVAALLFLEVWRHASVHSAQATTRPSSPTVEAVVGDISPAVTTASMTTTTRPASAEVKRADVKRSDKPRAWSKTSSPLEVSHKQVTDPETLSAVQELSTYEIKGLRRKAKYGDDSAAFTLGMAYEVGRFVPQNCVEAARWVTTAADAGDAAAQYNLGLRYREGDGVPANRAESEHWLRKAARKNRQAKLALRILASR